MTDSPKLLANVFVGRGYSEKFCDWFLEERPGQMLFGAAISGRGELSALRTSSDLVTGQQDFQQFQFELSEGVADEFLTKLVENVSDPEMTYWLVPLIRASTSNVLSNS